MEAAAEEAEEGRSGEADGEAEGGRSGEAEVCRGLFFDTGRTLTPEVEGEAGAEDVPESTKALILACSRAAVAAASDTDFAAAWKTPSSSGKSKPSELTAFPYGTPLQLFKSKASTSRARLASTVPFFPPGRPTPRPSTQKPTRRRGAASPPSLTRTAKPDDGRAPMTGDASDVAGQQCRACVLKRGKNKNRMAFSSDGESSAKRAHNSFGETSCFCNSTSPANWTQGTMASV